MADLQRQQQLFWKLVVAPEGAASGVAALPRAERELASRLIRERAGMTAIERLDVYANMYFFRVLDVLKQDFPMLHAALGDDAFHNLITDYLIAHPPKHWSLRWVGESLPEFVRAHERVRNAGYLADLAALEWALHDAFDAEDVPALRSEALAALKPEQWADLVLHLDPSVRYLEVATPVSRIWQQLKAGQEVDAGDDGGGFVRVWRRDMRVLHRMIPAFEGRALVAVAERLPFAEICERLAEADADPQQVAADLVAVVRGWLAEGVLAERAETR